MTDVIESRHLRIIFLIPFFLFFALTSCEKLNTQHNPPFDEWVRTPIPDATLRAYQANTPAANKMQAVIAARANLLTSGVRPVHDPRVVSAEHIRYEDAILRMHSQKSDQDLLGQKVWLVNFEGDFMLSSPAGSEEMFFGNIYLMLIPGTGAVVSWSESGQPYPFPLQAIIPITTPVAYPPPEYTPIVKIDKEILTPIPGGISTLNPEEIATAAQYFREKGLITLEDNGQTVAINLGTRFFVYLDDEKYPLKALTCEPEYLFGYISNGSMYGPDRYPIYFETGKPGMCILRNGDFSVTILVVEPTPDPRWATSLPTYAPTHP